MEGGPTFNGVVREGLLRRCPCSSGLKDTQEPARQRGPGRGANVGVRRPWLLSYIKTGRGSSAQRA